MVSAFLVRVCPIVIIVLHVAELIASQDTIGPNGIRSAGLTDGTAQQNPLNGSGVVIGQVEGFRPGKPQFDTVANCCNADVKPTGVFYRDQPMNTSANMGVGDDHAEAVAGIMISTNMTDVGAEGTAQTGVATAAMLNAAAAPFADLSDQPTAAVTAQAVANIPNMRAINMSFGLQLTGGVTALDGSSLLTEFIDCDLETAHPD